MVDDKEDLLTKEIQSWDSFKYTLREENPILFGQMLKECQREDDKKGEVVQFANAVNTKGESFAAESLFMALILLQQRMINRLSCQI
jgi:hypothetical protein